MVELTTRDADGVSRPVRISMSGVDLTARERKVMRNARFPDFLRHILTAGSLLLFGAFVAAIASTTTKLEWVRLVAGTLFGAGMLCLVAGGIWMIRRWVDFKEGDVVARGWLKVGRCAACGRRIEGSPAEEDGGVQCAACGARWQPMIPHRSGVS